MDIQNCEAIIIYIPIHLMSNDKTSQATLEKVREMRHRREHDESTTFDGLSHEDIWQIASLVESQAKKLEEMKKGYEEVKTYLNKINHMTVEREKKQQKEGIFWDWRDEAQKASMFIDNLLSSLS